MMMMMMLRRPSYEVRLGPHNPIQLRPHNLNSGQLMMMMMIMEGPSLSIPAHRGGH